MKYHRKQLSHYFINPIFPITVKYPRFPIVVNIRFPNMKSFGSIKVTLDLEPSDHHDEVLHNLEAF